MRLYICVPKLVSIPLNWIFYCQRWIGIRGSPTNRELGRVNIPSSTDAISEMMRNISSGTLNTAFVVMRGGLPRNKRSRKFVRLYIFMWRWKLPRYSCRPFNFIKNNLVSLYMCTYILHNRSNHCMNLVDWKYEILLVSSIYNISMRNSYLLVVTYVF